MFWQPASENHTVLIKKLPTLTRLLIISLLQLAHNVHSADTIYHGGTILTMDGDTPAYVEAVLTDNEADLFDASSLDRMVVSDVLHRSKPGSPVQRQNTP